MPRPWRARSRARDTGLRTHSRPRTPRPRAPGARSRGVSSRRAALGAPRRRAATTKGRRGRRVGTPGSLSRSNDNGCGVSSAQHCRAATAIISHADGSARLLLRSHCDPMTAAPAPPLILIAANPEHSLASVFEGRNYIVVQVHTGTLAGEWVRDVRPDTIIIDADPAEPKAGSIVVRSARVSDVVGALSPTEFAVLAPGTDQAGAVKLAKRIGGALRDVVGASGSLASAPALQIGYDAVPNLKYSPIDPVALLLRATTAVRTGTPEPGCSWMRRFDEAKAAYKGAGV